MAVNHFNPLDQHRYFCKQCNEPSHQNLHCLRFCYRFLTQNTYLLQRMCPNSEMKEPGRSKKKKAKIFLSEIQDGRHGSHSKNLSFASSPEPKGQLTWNLVRFIEVTYRSKVAKIVSIGNTRWLLPSWKSILNFLSLIERAPLTRNLIWSIGVT